VNFLSTAIEARVMVSFPFAFEDIQKRLEFLANDISVTTKV